jgi:hypothetical protein
MESESVRLSLAAERARIVASFNLRNIAGERISLEVGLTNAARPARITFRETVEVEEWAKDPVLLDFPATVDGVPVVWVPKDGLGGSRREYRGWLCWPMEFSPGERKLVEVSYEIETSDPNYTEPSPLRNRLATYVLKTGGGWAGPIGSATIFADFGALGGAYTGRVSPPPTRRTDTVLTWELKNFEPESDVVTLTASSAMRRMRSPGSSRSWRRRPTTARR